MRSVSAYRTRTVVSWLSGIGMDSLHRPGGDCGLPGLRPADHHQGVGIIGPLLAIGELWLISVLDPPAEVLRPVRPPLRCKPVLVLVQVLGHDLAIVDPEE